MFCWNEGKYRYNIDKHKVAFELAEALFLNVVAEKDDTRFDYGERRVNAYGYIEGRLFVCTYTPVYGWRHIISLRKANAREVRRYG
jgi:Uncharacterized protein conserved in bacteria